MFNLTLKGREIILFFLIVVINELIWIDSNIGLDMCEGGWREEVSKIEISLLNLLKESECRVLVQIVLCIFFSFFKLIIFKSIIQFLFVLFPLLLCLHQQVLIMLVYIVLCILFLFKLIIFRSIVQFLFILFPLLLCLHQQVLIMLV